MLGSLSLFSAAQSASESLPALLQQAERAVQSVMQGEHRQRKAGAGDKFWQFREYTHQDRPQDIDWRQSGKTEKVFVREKELHNAQETLFWCASDASMEYASAKNLPTKKQAAQVLCLAAAMLMTRAHELVKLSGGSFRAGRTEKTVELLAQELYSQKNKNLSSFSLSETKINTALFLASDFLEDINVIEQTLQSAFDRHDSGFVLQVLDPAELNLPFEGRVKFEAADLATSETIDNVTSIREAYQVRIMVHLGAMQELCKKLGFTYLLHTTDRPATETLHKIWVTLDSKNRKGQK